MNKEFYIGEDGLNYCATCREPVEVLLPEKVQTYLNMKTHPRQCACIRERNAREEKERKEREHNRVSQNRERKIATRYYCDEFHRARRSVA